MSIEAINARNQFRGKVKEIVHGPVVSEIVIETPHGIVTSVATTRSIRELKLEIGSDVLALVKATEVSIAKV